MVLISNALSNLKAYKLRVFVAMIWIVLGITSVVIVASIGNGLEAKIEEASDNADKRTVTIEFYPTYNEMSNFLQPFTRQDIEMVSFMDGVEKVDTSGENSKKGGSLYTTLFKDKNESNSIIYGYNKDEKIDIEFGRGFGYEDEDRKVVVIAYQVALDLFGNPTDAIGEFIDINDKDFEIIGVVAEDKSVARNNYDEWRNCYIPKSALNQVMSMYGNESTVGLTSINVTILPGYDVMQTAYKIADELRAKNGEDNGFYSAFNDNSALNELQELQSYISEFTSMLTAVSLFIGGIGIMNIMYMSVVERKREIGIRRAIGAKPKNILTQFLIESVVITSLGGIVGILSGIITSVVMSDMLPFKIVPTIESYIYAVGTSMLIGVVFGIIPAIKASRLDPIKAIQG